MRAVGWLLLFLAGVCLWSSFGMDYLDPGTIRGGAAGLRDYQLAAIMLSVGLFIGGLLLVTKK